MALLTKQKLMLFNRIDPRVLLEDLFNGSAVNTNYWTITDTESKITVSGGLLRFSGGLAIPAWGNPAIISKAPYFWARQAGLTIEWQITPTLATKTCLSGFTAGNLDGNEEHGIALWDTGEIRVIPTSSTVVVPLTYSAAQSLWARIVCKATGAYYYVSTDDRVTWEIIWINSNATATPLYVFTESYDAALTANKCKVYLGSVKPSTLSVTPAASTPTYGAELIVNGGFGADTDWAKGTGWSIAAGVATAGPAANGQNITNTGGVACVVGAWYNTVFDMSGYVSGGVDMTPDSLAEGIYRSANGTYTQPHRAKNAGNSAIRPGGANFQGNIDNVSRKQITLASMHVLVGDAGKRNGVYRCYPTASVGSPQGMAICVDSDTTPTYELQVYTNGTNVVLATWEAGVGAAALIDTATGVTYTAGRELRAVVNGTNVAIYYESAAGVFTQIGTTQTVANLASYGTIVCSLDPDGAGNSGLNEVDN